MDAEKVRREFEEDWRSFRPFLKQDLVINDIEAYEYRVSKMKASMYGAGVTKHYVKLNLQSHLDNLEVEVKRERNERKKY